MPSWAGASTYRAIMAAVRRFPSKNRNKLAAEVRAEFRANAATPPGPARDAQRSLALDSLAKLRAYGGAAATEGEASISLG